MITKNLMILKNEKIEFIMCSRKWSTFSSFASFWISRFCISTIQLIHHMQQQQTPHSFRFILFILFDAELFIRKCCVFEQDASHSTASTNNCFVFIANAIQDKSHLFDMRGSSFVNKSIWLPFKINKWIKVHFDQNW